MPQSYSVFGGALFSDVFFPELVALPAQSPVSWAVRKGSSAAIPVTGELLGVLPDIRCRTELGDAGRDGLVFAHSCTGRYSISRDGSTVLHALDESAPLDVIRSEILGRVLPIALHLQGFLSLHASAVALTDGAIGLIAPKGYGKSTLSLALACAGGRFVSDDTLPILPGSPAYVCRGIQSVRVRDDSAALIGAHSAFVRRGMDGKVIIDELPVPRLESERAPLAALYLLAPVECVGGDVPVARRERLATWRAAMELVRHAKVGSLLGGAEGAVIFERATQVARTTPVFTLSIGRDLALLPHAVTTIARWHGGFPCT